MNMSIILIIFLILLEVAVIGFFYSLYFGLLFTTPWVPLSQKDVDRMLKLAEISSNDILYDLGSGDGRIVLTAAKKYKIKTVGIEIAWPLYLWSNILVRLTGLKKLVKIKCENFLKSDLSEASIVVFYLSPKTIARLVPILKEKLKPGTKIISARFKINEWPALKIDQPAAKDTPIYCYKL